MGGGGEGERGGKNCGCRGPAISIRISGFPFERLLCARRSEYRAEQDYVVVFLGGINISLVALVKFLNSFFTCKECPIHRIILKI